METTKRSRNPITRQANPPGEIDPHPTNSTRSSAGGRALVEKRGSEHMAEIGRKGANSVARRYGLRFYSEIAARNKGVRKGQGTASG